MFENIKQSIRVAKLQSIYSRSAVATISMIEMLFKNKYPKIKIDKGLPVSYASNINFIGCVAVITSIYYSLGRDYKWIDEKAIMAATLYEFFRENAHIAYETIDSNTGEQIIHVMTRIQSEHKLLSEKLHSGIINDREYSNSLFGIVAEYL